MGGAYGFLTLVEVLSSSFCTGAYNGYCDEQGFTPWYSVMWFCTYTYINIRDGKGRFDWNETSYYVRKKSKI